METKDKTPEPVVVEYSSFYLTKINDLISLTSEYRERYVPELLEHLKKHYNVSILFKRMGYKQKILSGRCENITETGFTFITNESFDSETISEEEIAHYVRFDNALGWVPFKQTDLAEKTEPWENPVSEKTKAFFASLAKMKPLFRECLECPHKTTISLRFKENKKEIVDCKILEVNESNVVIEQYRSTTTNEKGTSSYTLGKLNKVVLYVGPEYYLQKTEVTLGVEHDIPPFDFDDENGSSNEKTTRL